MIIDHQGVAEAGELALRLRSLATNSGLTSYT
jgi:hypothetical protein